MAYTQSQTIADTNSRLVVKRINYGNTETSALVVNASALSYAVVTIPTDNSANNFQVGETVNSTSGGTATVQDVVNGTSLTVISLSGTFADNDTITGVTTGRTRTQDGSVSNATYVLEVANLLYDIGATNHAAKVELMWEGTGGGANNRTVAILSGTGQLSLAEMNMRANNNANSATGNLILSTLHWDANAHYTLLADVSKREGYALPNTERNVLGRY